MRFKREAVKNNARFSQFTTAAAGSRGPTCGCNLRVGPPSGDYHSVASGARPRDAMPGSCLCPATGAGRGRPASWRYRV